MGTDELIERLGSIERRLSRIEGGLMLAGFVVGVVLVPLIIVVVDHVR